jgi:peptide/nickel transport system substrate-binding protein
VPALSDVAVRKALSYAIDRSAMVQVVWNGDALPTASPLSPTMLGYDKAQETYALPYDVAKAKATLQPRATQRARTASCKRAT